MRITIETNLNTFNFWAGAKDNKKRFSYEELNQLNDMLDDCYPEGMDETMLNDIMWFEPETLCEWLDIDFNEWIERGDDYYNESLSIPLF